MHHLVPSMAQTVGYVLLNPLLMNPVLLTVEIDLMGLALMEIAKQYGHM